VSAVYAKAEGRFKDKIRELTHRHHNLDARLFEKVRTATPLPIRGNLTGVARYEKDVRR
jgi:hypothetical protein